MTRLHVNNGILLEAITEWKETIGTTSVLLKKEDIAPYTANTIGVNRIIKGILIPKCTAEVQSIVRIAKKYKTPLYPISGGKNWGYGSANPVEDNAFIVDLSRMKKISDYDPDLGVVTVEPGVTQQDLFEFLKNHGGQFMVPTTGAGPSASILGNALERGYGLTPHSDHFEAVTSFQAVLPNGDLYKPALEELGGEKINQLFKWGVGPYIDGLFTQGNFGIVTKGTILIVRRPEHISAFFFSLKNDSCLEGAVLAVRKIKQELGSHIGAINIMNTRRVLSMLEPFPKEDGKTVIDDDAVKKLAQKHQLTAWAGFGSIYTKAEMANSLKKIITKHLKPYVARINFISEKTIRISRVLRFVFPSFYKNNLKPKLDMLASAIQNISGQPSQVALPLAYWRSDKIPNMKSNLNPALDNCGLIWHAPLIPLNPKDIRKHVSIVNEICPKHGINPLITLTIFSGQCCDSTIPILFDKNNQVEEFKAKSCHEELLNKENYEGYIPYRLGIDIMNRVVDQTAPCWAFAQLLKKAIDPDQIIAPGRYIPLSENSRYSKSKNLNEKIFNIF